MCLGRNVRAELGRGTMSANEVAPQPVVGLGWTPGTDRGALTDVVAIAVGGAAGNATSCALVKQGGCGTGGRVVCWGAGGKGQLGSGTAPLTSPPVLVLSP